MITKKITNINTRSDFYYNLNAQDIKTNIVIAKYLMFSYELSKSKRGLGVGGWGLGVGGWGLGVWG